MARQISKSKIIQAILDGVGRAHEKYENMSGGWWLGSAPEYFITSSIAESISDLNKVFVTLEHGVTDIRCEAGFECKGPMPKKMRDKGRSDVLVWWASDFPRVVIEVKNNVYSVNKIKNDMERLDSLLSKNGSVGKLQFGAIAFYTSSRASSRNSAVDILNNRCDDFYKKINDMYFKKYKITKHMSDLSQFSEEKEAWAGMCFGFHPYKKIFKILIIENFSRALR